MNLSLLRAQWNCRNGLQRKTRTTKREKKIGSSIVSRVTLLEPQKSYHCSETETQGPCLEKLQEE